MGASKRGAFKFIRVAGSEFRAPGSEKNPERFYLMPSEKSASGVQIRAAVKNDASAIASILYEAFSEFEPVYTPGGFAATVIPEDDICGRWVEGPVARAAFLFLSRPSGTAKFFYNKSRQ